MLHLWQNIYKSDGVLLQVSEYGKPFNAVHYSCASTYGLLCNMDTSIIAENSLCPRESRIVAVFSSTDSHHWSFKERSDCVWLNYNTFEHIISDSNITSLSLTVGNDFKRTMVWNFAQSSSALSTQLSVDWVSQLKNFSVEMSNNICRGNITKWWRWPSKWNWCGLSCRRGLGNAIFINL